MWVIFWEIINKELLKEKNFNGYQLVRHWTGLNYDELIPVAVNKEQFDSVINTRRRRTKLLPNLTNLQTHKRSLNIEVDRCEIRLCISNICRSHKVFFNG